MKTKRNTQKLIKASSTLLGTALAVAAAAVPAQAAPVRTDCSLTSTSDPATVMPCSLTWHANSVRVTGAQRNQPGTFFDTQTTCFDGLNASGHVVPTAIFCTSALTGHPLTPKLHHFTHLLGGRVAAVREQVFDPAGNLAASKTFPRP
jgi:hypothetical protein